MRIIRSLFPRRTSFFSYLIKVLILFAVYFFTAIIGLKINAVGGFATLIWFPTGISLSALLLFGYELWPAILGAAFLTNIFTGAPPAVALGISIGNTLEAFIAVYLLRKIGFKNSFDRLKPVLGFILFAVILSTFVSATIGTTSLWVGHTISLPLYGATWLAWWVGDMISNLVIAPLILVWAKVSRLKLKYPNPYELVGVSVLLILLSWIVFSNPFDIKIENSPISYLVFPPLIWIGIRFRQKETITATFVLSLIAIVSTIHGNGPFARADLSKSLIFLQGFMTATALTFLILTAVVSERRWLEKLKDELLTIISHELKTPVTSIKAYTQLLKKQFEKKGDPQTVKYLNRMDGQLNKLTNMINDLLDLSRIEDQNLQLKKSMFFILPLIKETAENIQATVRTHTIYIKGTVKQKVFADKVRIEQVLTNLLSNAVKYSPRGKKVMVTLDSDSERLIVGIKDFGIGISPQYHQKVFHRFFRVIEAKETSQSGFGIGLYLSKEIIQRHGGKIWVESRPYKGSTFYFTLPL